MDKDTKILIADENNEVRNHIHERLAVNGAGLIDEVKNGDEAMKMISRQSYDIVISDLWLPSLDAASIMKRTAESGKNAPSFVIHYAGFNTLRSHGSKQSRRVAMYAEAHRLRYIQR